MGFTPNSAGSTKEGCIMIYRFNISAFNLIAFMAALVMLRMLSEAYFSHQRMVSDFEATLIQDSSKKCQFRWSYLPERNPDGAYNLSFRYCIDPLQRVAKYVTFPLNRINKKSQGHNISFAEMTQIPDTDWKRPMHPGVFLLYPQGLALREVINNYRKTGFVPEHPINSPSIKLLKVSTSVCPPEEGNGYKRAYNHDLVVIVKSAVYNFEDRRKFRRLYAHLRKESVKLPYRIGIVFFMGIPTSAQGNVFQRDGFNVTLPGRAGNSLINLRRHRDDTQNRLKEELQQHDDLVVGDFEDTYFNLSLKLHHAFVWAARFCRGRPGFLFLDDDFAFHEKNLLAALAKLPANWRRTVSISITRWSSPTVRPNMKMPGQKWALSKAEIPWPEHAPYSNGYFYMLGYDHVADLALAMFFTKPIPIDDVWLGLVMQRIDVQFQLPAGFTYALKPQANVSGYIGLPLHYILNAP
uniref:Hexosyltransferase n=1 Tax=Schistocephalus solidus TaxID=70667 RepID=A0A0X3Q626_SCHSO